MFTTNQRCTSEWKRSHRLHTLLFRCHSGACFSGGSCLFPDQPPLAKSREVSVPPVLETPAEEGEALELGLPIVGRVDTRSSPTAAAAAAAAAMTHLQNQDQTAYIQQQHHHHQMLHRL